MLIDAHTHLNGELLFADWQTHMHHFQQTGGKILINAGAQPVYNTNGILIATQAKTLFPELTVKATIGFHPEDATNIAESDFGKLIEMLKEQYREHPSEVIALGECGIDLHYPTHRNLAHQQELFRLQAVLARELQLPLVIHSRDAYVETLEVIKDFTDLKVYFHCWGYGAAQLRQIEELFPRVWFGFTNILTYPHAHTTREAFLAANKAHLLLETDAPFLPPQTFRGKTNYPAYITYGYAYAAELLQMKTEAVEDLIAQNFSAFYHQ